MGKLSTLASILCDGDTLQEIKNAYRDQDIAGNQGNSDLPVMSREDWAPQTQDNMKQWRHGIVHHFANFDEAHEKDDKC